MYSFKQIYALFSKQDEPKTENGKRHAELQEEINNIHQTYDKQDKQDKQNKKADCPDSIANIIFSLLPTGQVHINCQWEDEALAIPYGEMLYNINEGIFTEDIVNILIEYAETEPEHFDAVAIIIDSWRSQKERVDSQPYISPSQVFSQEPSDLKDLEDG